MFRRTLPEEPRRFAAERGQRHAEQDLANPGNNLDRQATRHRAQLERQIAESRTQLKNMSALVGHDK